MAESTESSTEEQDSVSSSKATPESVNVSEELETPDPKLNEIEVEHHPDCPVCLQSCNYPVQLPCGHIFCYLCIKGVALRSRRCALCRQDITVDSIENPTLVKPVSSENAKASKVEEADKDQGYVWFYEGRNGWWQYDEKTAIEVEKAFKSGKRSCQLLIAGFLYVIDFENMFQMRRNEPGRRRRIKRDKPDAERKGVAGIRLPVKVKPKSATTDTETSDKSDNSSASSSTSNTVQGKGSEEHDKSSEQDSEGQQEVLVNTTNQQEVSETSRGISAGSAAKENKEHDEQDGSQSPSEQSSE